MGAPRWPSSWPAGPRTGLVCCATLLPALLILLFSFLKYKYQGPFSLAVGGWTGRVTPSRHPPLRTGAWTAPPALPAQGTGGLLDAQTGVANRASRPRRPGQGHGGQHGTGVGGFWFAKPGCPSDLLPGAGRGGLTVAPVNPPHRSQVSPSSTSPLLHAHCKVTSADLPQGV